MVSEPVRPATWGSLRLSLTNDVDTTVAFVYKVIVELIRQLPLYHCTGKDLFVRVFCCGILAFATVYGAPCMLCYWRFSLSCCDGRCHC
jgi:hypothetical protein